MKVLITGGAGFIGYHLAKNLISKGYSVDLVDDFSRAVMDSSLKKLINEQGVSLININLLSEIDCKKIKNHYNYIYHLAAVIGVKHVLASPQIVLSNNFLLLNNAIAIAKRQKNLDRFVFASTSEVYAGTLAHFGLEFPTLESTVLTVNDLSQT